MPAVDEGLAEETSVKVKCWNNELVSLTGLQLSGRIRLFRAVPLWAMKLRAVPGGSVKLRAVLGGTMNIQ